MGVELQVGREVKVDGGDEGGRRREAASWRDALSPMQTNKSAESTCQVGHD